MSFAHRTLAVAFIAGCSIVGCWSSDPADDPVSEDQDALQQTVCGTGNEGSSVTLTCPAGQTITAVNFASYGRPRGTCGSFSRTTCNATTSRAVVENACLGRSSCVIQANNATFGDPCVGTVKRLYVQATCSDSGGTTSSGATGSGGASSSSASTTSASSSSASTTSSASSSSASSSSASSSSASGGGETCAGAGPETTPLDAEEQSFLQIINQYRAQNGLSTLSACTSLNRAAQGHSEDLRDQDYFSHTSLDGRSPWDRSCNACYELGCGPRTAMGENIAAGNSGAQATFDQWKNSPGHNANMLGSGFRVIGIGRATGGGTYGSYWTTVFGGASEGSCL